MESAQLINRLSALRASIRRRLVGFGACGVAAGGIAAFLTVVLLDWFLWLPSAIRIIVAVWFFFGFAAAAWNWILRPLGATVALDEVAARLEHRFTILRDRLTSSVNFLELGDAGSKEMMRHVVADTERIIERMPLESALSLRPLLRSSAILAASVAALGLVRWTSPGFLATGFYRYVYPWGEIEWPRAVAIMPMTGHLKVAIGESATVRMRVRRGLTETLRGVVHLKEPDGGMTVLAMQRDRDGTYFATVDAVTRNLDYWFEAGDSDTTRTPGSIRALRRPEVLEAIAAVRPPPYAPDAPVRVQDLADGPVRATVGGLVDITLRASKPVVIDVPNDADEPVGLQTEGGEVIPLTPIAGEAAKLTARVDVAESLDFWVRLRDEDGFENRGAARYSILAVPDSPPVLTILEPTAVTELTPRGSVELHARVEDDFGIVHVELNAETLGGGGPHADDLTGRLRTTRGESGVDGVLTYVWSVESLALAPGDIVVYQIAATDNRPPFDGQPQTGRSGPMRIKVISDTEFDTRVRGDLALLETRIRQVALEQTDVLDRTAALLRAEDDPAALDDVQRDAAGVLAERQARLVRRLRDLSGRFLELTRRMERNQAGKEDDRARVAALAQGLKDAAMGSMSTAGNALDEVRENTAAGPQQDRLRLAARTEEEAINQLQTLLHSMSQWGSFQEVVTKAQDLIDRQNTLRTTTGNLSKEMLGKPVESLSEEEASRLKRAGREQEQLGRDVQQLVGHMERLATTLKSKDPAGAEAIDDAIRAARANEIDRHLREAVEGIQENRTAATTMAQRSAADAMRKMASALRQRENRELEELRKRLEQAADRVAALIEEQKGVRAATHEADLLAAGTDQLATLEQQQHTVRRNTKAAADELAEQERAVTAAKLVRQATAPMTLAEQHLRESQAATATSDQDEALSLLDEGLAELNELADAAANETVRRTLAQIREALETIREAQAKINEGIGELRNAIASTGRIGRGEARSASNLARQQSELRSVLEAQRPDVERVVVYQWALERVAGWMEDGKARLTDRRIDDELVGMTDRIVRELDKLIDAIVQTEALPLDTQFVESDAGGDGGNADQAGQKSVPTVAELFVLKALQTDVNQRTESLHGTLDVDQATEQQLRELRTLGEDQAEVRRLTDRLVERAKRP